MLAVWNDLSLIMDGLIDKTLQKRWAYVVQVIKVPYHEIQGLDPSLET